MKRIPLKTMLLLLWPLLFQSCQNEPEPQPEMPLVTDTLNDFEHLLERGTLVAVTNCSAINYNTYNAVPSGFEYELLNDFCNSHRLKLEMVVNDNLDSCFSLLDSCQVDVVATGIGLTREMKKRYLLTNPILSEKSVLVQRMPRGWNAMSTGTEVENQLLRSPLELAQKTVFVNKGSHAEGVLAHLAEEIGDTIFVVTCDTLNSIELVQAVANGNIDYAVVEEYVAKMASAGLRGLDTKLAVSVEHPIGWAIRKRDADSSLLTAINTWIDGFEQKQLRRVLNKYVNNGKMLVSGDAHKPGQISIYDKAIRKTAKKIGWDWRMLAALIYKESRFRPDQESEKGAFGLMQLMPVTMERFGITYESTPEEQLEAGGKLLQFLNNALVEKVADSTERVKFVLAAYNAGLGHVVDAQRLAEKYGKSPDVWDDNVDYFILNKSKAEYYNDSCCRNGYLRGAETYRFVEEVLERYNYYVTIIN